MAESFSIDNDAQFARLKSIKEKAQKLEREKASAASVKALSIKEKLIRRTYSTILVPIDKDLVLTVRARTSNEENQLLKDAFKSLEEIGKDITEEEYQKHVNKIARLMYVFVLNDELDLEFWQDPSNWSVDIVLKIITTISKENEELVKSIDEQFRENTGGTTAI